ncbi:MAG: hypothetical protein IJV67_08290 [Clostridia bacterium]|nr:hypothetical protein [Clostridia bacterium]MBR2968778.1 hypothetical protein [Clostridia bacterium]
MRYHISTSLILQEFCKTDSECPLCEIRSIVEKNVVEQYLNEAVMVTGVRYKVNEKGFCSDHFDMLFAGQSKLGLALQCVTRMNVLKQSLEKPSNYNAAKKQAKALIEAEKTCIICDTVEDHMQRYYKTVAELYFNEEDFRDLIGLTKGFCLKDYAQLVMNARYAATKVNEYVKVLSEIEKKNFEKIQSDLQWFCDRHDFRNAGKALDGAKDALPRTRTKIYGKKKQ